MTRRLPLLVYDLPPPSRYTLLKGPIHDWLAGQDIPVQWVALRRGWIVRTDRLSDLVAMAEHDGFNVHMKGPAK